ncbi:SCO family protein [Paraneptunicella aestuarii]|uniref:SCO family protein n=1 Tax=Paraneptunicella aestuarii TaxID=2831148 RepID=UPI001E53C7D8|nr:SCO family protein [Paraneptunicella aestuarii]UAA38874.1 SCO family protein [Paraneptunicella aestuarii]
MKNILLILLAIIGLAGGVYLANHLNQPQDPQFAQLYPQARALNDVHLTNQHGELIDAKWFEGKWTLTFVGYTYCPDICPTTLAELKSIYPQLKQIESEFPVQILFLSVDPKRDTIPRLKEYVDFFNPEFIAATAEHKFLFPVVRAMGMMYSMSDSTENNDYLVDHSASIVIINPDAQVVGRFVPVNEPGKIAISDGEQILADMPIVIGNYHK